VERPDVTAPERPSKRAAPAGPFVAIVAVVAAPAAAYLWFIGHFAMNVVYFDQWYDVDLLWDPSLSRLWALHNENRMLFPNIIVGLQELATHLDVVSEEFLSAAMLIVATGLIVWSHRRRSPSTRWIRYLPVPIIMGCVVQAASTLWGFQLAWYLITLALATTVFLLDRPGLTGLVLAAAVAAAVVGSYSSIQGLLIWPAGLMLLWQRRRGTRAVVTWLAAAVGTTIVYFIGFNSNQTYSDRAYVSGHPLADLKAFFFLIGDVSGAHSTDDIGNPIPHAPQVHTNLVIALGCLIAAIAVWVLVRYGRRDEAGGSPIGIAQVVFGLLFALATALERLSPYGGPVRSVGASRYTTFTLLVLAGIYLATLERPRPWATHRRSVRTDHRCQTSVEAVATDGEPATLLHRSVGRTVSPVGSYRVMRTPVLGVVALCVVVGTWTGIDYGRYWHQRQLVIASVTANIHGVPNALVSTYLLPGDAKFARQMAAKAEAKHLSLFASPDAVARLRQEGLPGEFTEVSTHIAAPLPGAVLSGVEIFDASASGQLGLVKVEFLLTGGSLHNAPIAAGTPTLIGWLASWDSRTVADGTYHLRTVAYGSDGRTSTSPPVEIEVANHH
jgi:hypothetical protein